MRLPDGTILTHANAPYDPVKAHEYYLKTRQLTGRKRGQAITFTVRTRGGKTVTLTRQQLVEQQVYAAKRVQEIKQNLVKLAGELRIAMKKAKEKDAKTKREEAKPKTAAEKAQTARDSKQYRSKHRQSLATKQAAAKKKTPKKSAVHQLEDRIGELRGKLLAAVETQRALTSATRN